MPTIAIHPKAFLTKKRNVRSGIQARSIILSSLEHGPRKTRDICAESNFSYPKVVHHVSLLVKERLVAPTGKKKPHVWCLTEYGQQRLQT